MHEDDNITDIIVVRGGSEVGSQEAGRRGVEKTPGKAGEGDAEMGEASALAEAVAENDEENGWKTVTRAAARGRGRPKKTAIVSQPVFSFTAENPGETTRKRRSVEALSENWTSQTRNQTREEGMADEIRGLKGEVQQLRELVQKLATMIQEQREEGKVRATRSEQQEEEQSKKIDSQTRKIELLHGVVERGVSKPSYSEIVQGNNRRQPSQAAQSATPKTNGPRSRSTQGEPGATSPRYRDERVVTIDTISTASENKRDLAQVKENLQRGIDGDEAIRGTKIQCICQLGTRGIDIVFETKDQAEGAKSRPEWISTALAGARLKSDEWYPVKCDGVAKQVVLDETARDGRTLRQGVLDKFREDNSTGDIDCTAMKASWLSRNYPNKTVGSLVIYLKAKKAADYLPSLGNAIFGPAGATCSRFERLENDGPCFNCNKYGHKQTNCRRAECCGNCSGKHNTRLCDGTRPRRCPACAGEHTIFDRRCPQHPRRFYQSNPDTRTGQNLGRGGDRERDREQTQKELSTSVKEGQTQGPTPAPSQSSQPDGNLGHARNRNAQRTTFTPIMYHPPTNGGGTKQREEQREGGQPEEVTVVMEDTSMT
jgi:TolA-binding protein